MLRDSFVKQGHNFFFNILYDKSEHCHFVCFKIKLIYSLHNLFISLKNKITGQTKGNIFLFTCLWKIKCFVASFSLSYYFLDCTCMYQSVTSFFFNCKLVKSPLLCYTNNVRYCKSAPYDNKMLAFALVLVTYLNNSAQNLMFIMN